MVGFGQIWSDLVLNGYAFRGGVRGGGGLGGVLGRMAWNETHEVPKTDDLRADLKIHQSHTTINSLTKVTSKRGETKKNNKPLA